jgi:hypothetical protein
MQEIDDDLTGQTKQLPGLLTGFDKRRPPLPNLNIIHEPTSN